MANLPYVTKNSDKVLGIMKMYSRMGAYPLDATNIFNSLTDLNTYISETGSYAYPGQVVAVANGSIENNNGAKNYSLYVIRSDMSVQELGKNLLFNSTTDATTYVQNNPDAYREGEVFTIKNGSNYDLYTFKSDGTLQKLNSGSSSSTVEWDSIENKPTSSTDDIDSVVDFVNDNLSSDDDHLTYGDKKVAFKDELDALFIISETEPTNQPTGGLWFQIVE